MKLIYSASARCPCGAGLAYEDGINSVDNYWDCSAIMLGTAIPKGEEGSVQHTAKLPFIFYEVKSERNTRGKQTTRPQES